MVRQWFRALINLVFPRICFACNAKLSQGILCQRCREQIFLFNPPLLRQGKNRTYDSLISITGYNGPMVQLIHLFKYRHYDFLQYFFAALMADHLKKWGFNARSFDCISHVPAHPLRIREREYNQTELLARQAGKALGLPFRNDLLACSRYYRSQTAVSPARRKDNIKNAFTVKKSPRGLKIILIDDVFTTGATVSECSRILKKQGADQVTVLTLTKAG